MLLRSQGGSLSWAQRCGRACVVRSTRARTSRLHIHAQAQQRAQPVFNRTEELGALSDILSNIPYGIFLLSGPYNTGKTAILQELASRLSVPQVRSGKRQIFLTVNCRMGDTTTPSGFAAQLAASIDSENVKLDDGGMRHYRYLSQAGLKVLSGVAGFSLYDTIAAQPGGVAPLTAVLSSLGRWLKTRTGPPYPVIVIDQANRLKDWKDKRALQMLLDFLVYATKEQNLCHVILSTWDTSLDIWLHAYGITLGQYQMIELGDLTEEEIKAFVYDHGVPSTQQVMEHCVQMESTAENEFTLPKDLWIEAYELFGGNVGMWNAAISRAAADFKTHDQQDLTASWQRVFKAERNEAARFMKRPFWPAILVSFGGEPPRWTPRQYGKVLQAIADAPEPHVVPFTDLCAKIGEEALMSLVNHYYLALRTQSAWARDLPSEVFVEDETVVTAPCQAALEYIKTQEWQEYVPPITL